MYLPNFVMNRVPSDIYRLKNPKLVIKQSKKNGNIRYIENLKKIKKNQKEEELGIIFTENLEAID